MNCARGMCERLESCMDSACPEHPAQPWNQWGAGRMVSTDGGMRVSGDDTIPLYPRRQLMPDQVESLDKGDWMVLAIAGALFGLFLVFLAYLTRA